MARRPKNPINDIVDTVGGWLGGRGPGTNPQVRAAMDATRAVGKVVDTATGGFGSALISDAQRMAQSGSSTPSALYKTAAVNLGAAAAGAAAAGIVSKGVSKVTQRFTTDIGLHVSPNPNLDVIEYSSRTANTGMRQTAGFPILEGKTYKISGFPAHTPIAPNQNKLYPKKKINFGFGRYLDPKAMAGSAQSAGYTLGPRKSTTYITKSKTGRLDPELLNRFDRVTGKQEILAKVVLNPENRSMSGKFVSRQQNAALDAQYTKAVVDEIKKARTAIANRQNTTAAQNAVLGAVSGVSVPKKPRGGGKNKK